MEIQLEKCMCYENLCKNLVLISPRYSIFWKLHVMNNLTPRSQEDKISQKLHWGNDTAECDSSLAFPLWTAWSQTPRCRSHQEVKKTKFLKNSIEGMTPRSVTPRCHSHCGLWSRTPRCRSHRGCWFLKLTKICLSIDLAETCIQEFHVLCFLSYLSLQIYIFFVCKLDTYFF